jgi:hypothetical protein
MLETGVIMGEFASKIEFAPGTKTFMLTLSRTSCIVMVSICQQLF